MSDKPKKADSHDGTRVDPEEVDASITAEELARHADLVDKVVAGFPPSAYPPPRPEFTASVFYRMFGNTRHIPGVNEEEPISEESHDDDQPDPQWIMMRGLLRYLAVVAILFIVFLLIIERSP